MLTLYILNKMVVMNLQKDFMKKHITLCSLSPLLPRSMKRLVLSLMHVQVLSFIFCNISQIQFLQLAQASSDIVGVYLWNIIFIEILNALKRNQEF